MKRRAHITPLVKNKANEKGNQVSFHNLIIALLWNPYRIRVDTASMFVQEIAAKQVKCITLGKELHTRCASSGGG